MKTLPSNKKLNLLLVILIIGISGIYIFIFNNQLTNWDDEMYIFNNPYLKSLSFENLKNIFTNFFAGNYHPFTLISLAVNFKMAGIQPWPYQLTNLILHLCNVMFVYIFIKSLIRLKYPDSQQYYIVPFVTAVLFGIHTLQVESVAWVSERKNALYTFFFIPSLIFYIKYLNYKSFKTYILSVLLFVFSLLSKGMAVPLSICIIGIDYFAGRNLLSRKVVLEKIPYLALSLIFGMIAIVAQHSGNAIRDISFSLSERIAVASYGFTHYILKLIFPFGLSAYYPYPVKAGEALPYLYYLYILAPLLLMILLWRFLRRNRTVMFGTLFFIANIVIVIQLLPVGDAIMADRYVYVASIGFFFIIGSLCNLLWNSKANYRNIILSLFIVYCYAIGIKTFNRIGIWKDSLTLWNDSLKKYPHNNDRGYLNRGNVFYDMGKYVEALQDYNRLLKIDPNISETYIGVGLIKMAMNDLPGALDELNTSLSLKKTFEGYLNRAVIKTELEDFEGALADLKMAHLINPLSHEVYINRGTLELKRENAMDALYEYNKAVEINALSDQAYLGRAVAKIKTADYHGSIDDLNASIKLKPTAMAYYYRGKANLQLGYRTAGCLDLKKSVLYGKADAQAELEQNCIE